MSQRLRSLETSNSLLSRIRSKFAARSELSNDVDHFLRTVPCDLEVLACNAVHPRVHGRTAADERYLQNGAVERDGDPLL